VELETLEEDVDYDINFYTKFYAGTKETMGGRYETVAGFFGFREEINYNND